MARPKSKQPSYYASRGAYYCWHNGKQVLCAVGPEGDRETLERAFKVYWDLQHENDRGGKTDGMDVITCLNIYLGHLQRHKKAKTYTLRKVFCQSFVDYCGKHVAKTLTVSALTPALVNAWIEENERPRPHKTNAGRMVEWGEGSRYNAITTMKAALNHCVEMGHCVSNPIAKMKTPGKTSRAADVLISPAQHKAIFEYMGRRVNSRPFLDLLTALLATGCRPGELAGLTAKEVKECDGVLYLDLTDWKTEGKHDFRHIFLTETMEGIVRRLVERHPTGFLFRNYAGTKWTDMTICDRFARARKALSLPPTITAYSYRHTFATDWLLAGKSIKLLAQLMGNSVATIEKHYAHLLADKSAMQAALRAFRD